MGWRPTAEKWWPLTPTVRFGSGVTPSGTTPGMVGQTSPCPFRMTWTPTVPGGIRNGTNRARFLYPAPGSRSLEIVDRPTRGHVEMETVCRRVLPPPSGEMEAFGPGAPTPTVNWGMARGFPKIYLSGLVPGRIGAGSRQVGPTSWLCKRMGASGLGERMREANMASGLPIW